MTGEPRSPDTTTADPSQEPDPTTPEGTLFPLPDADPVVLGPDAVHLPGHLDLSARRLLVAGFRSWSAGPVPLRAAALPGGRRMSVETVCLGWHWQPYRYSRVAGDVNGEQVLPLPDWLARLGRDAVAAALGQERAAAWVPDAALVNFYSADARMGMHQDKDELSDAPVVSLSVGASCVFRFGNTANRGRPYRDVTLRSGDAFVFGGSSRFAYHGVPRTMSDADPNSGLAEGRVNVTLRTTGLEPASS